MRRVGFVAAIVMAALVVDCVVPAAANDVLNRRNQEHFLFFTGTDLWRGGAFLHGGMLWAVNRLEREGFVVKAMAGGGIYHYQSGALGDTEIRGREISGQLLAGWRFVRDALTLTAFVGLGIENHGQSPNDPGTKLRGGDLGVIGTLELWYQPVSDFMIAADASVTSVGPRLNARLAFGGRVFERIYVGPEIQRYQTDDYSQLRFGAHFTGLNALGAEWSAAVGIAHDSDHSRGAYGRIGVNVRR
ncbi:MAG: cellulose biosynthesis protein BcsS [Rhizobiales bacterium]|nr:cellulose biosynthesis protein BcsS [Hyphomicrobiales bacterium]